jgi:serine/threonine protein kinase
MLFSHLLKQKRSRFNDVNTIKIEKNTNCKNNKIVGIKSLKSSEEMGSDIDNFVSIIQSKLENYNNPVIVKIHDARNIMVLKELAAMRRLKGFDNVVKYICDFSCMDDKSRWANKINEPVTFCNNKQDNLHFIVMEYVSNGDISEYVKKASLIEIRSLLIQLVFTILILGTKYKMNHGDLNTGNILIQSTTKKRIVYQYRNKTYYVKSCGIMPVLIDFGRSSHFSTIQYESIMDEIFTAINVCVLYIQDIHLKTAFQTFIHQQFIKNSDSPLGFLRDLKQFFDDQ